MPPKSSTPASSRARHSVRSTRFGGACKRAVGPSTTRVVAIAARYSSRPRSSTCRIAVSGLARKFWTITSCTCPSSRETCRNAKMLSARSVRLSPMPTSTPVVNGMFSRPASSSTRNRTAGSLSGLPKCACPFSSNRRRDVVSSIIPIDGATAFNRFISAQLITPGLRCGRRPVSSSTTIAIARTYSKVDSKPASASHSFASGHRSSGRSPRVNSASLQPIDAPARAISSTSSGDRNGRFKLAGHRHERAVVAPVPAQAGERDEHLSRVRDHTRTTRLGEARIANAASHTHQSIEVLPAGRQQRGGLRDIDALAAVGPPDRASSLPRAGHRSCPVILIPACVL